VGTRLDEARVSSSASTEPLGVPSAGYGDLGPVSPELVLIDQGLAERARVLLPEPPGRPRPVPRAADLPPRVLRTPETAPPPLVRSRTRWRRMVALAILIFTAGAASGGLLGRGRQPSSRTPLQAQANVPATPTATGTERSATGALLDRASTTPRPQSSRSPLSKRASRNERRRSVAAWAANVLGVTTGVDRRGVRLAWERPTESNQVVVVRKLASHQNSVVVFRGQATSFRDVSARPCTAYRYVIINYDRRGRPSTGVPTSVVTQGCGRKRPSAA
jgi:hypothetical protein